MNILNLKKLMSTHFLLALIIILSSCTTSRKNTVYFVDSEKDGTTTKSNPFTLKLKPDDYLSISIYSIDVEAAEPFNKTNPKGNLGGGVRTDYRNGIPALSGFLIDESGFIDFPMIGKVKAAGLTRQELADDLVIKLTEYLKEPSINVSIQNFKITVLGDVRTPYTFNVPNERITILEAIGLSGDLNPTAKRKNVLLIRDNDGVKTHHRIDLTKSDLLSSNFYYLQQNDIIYVEPNRAKRNSGLVSSTAGTFISIASLIITTVVIILR
jgi:polysaccharide biosynthesis/export protein